MRLILVALMIAVTMPTTAHSQAACGPILKMIEMLAKQHGESPAVTFESAQGHVVGFYNPETQTWSMVTVQAGRACIRASGTGPMKFHRGKKGNKFIPGLPA